MRSSWEAFVAGALEPEPDDPFVRLLRERIDAGYKIRRINLLGGGRESPEGPPEYLAILEYRQQLSEMRVPHSDSFTRWSLQRGARLESTQEEERRFALLLAEKLAPLEAEVGRGYFSSILVESLQRLGPPRTMGILANQHAYAAAAGQAKLRSLVGLEGVLTSLAQDLGRSLNYSPQQAAAILDGALAALADERFHIRDRELLFPSDSPRR
ncbi:MAG TPA: hypothetical protein VGQ83_31140 [Polyangia bacterium]|jgi:hypothetical protein